MPVLFERVPDLLRWKRTSWANEKMPWKEKAVEGEDYYYSDIDDTGTLFTQEQLNKIEANTNIPSSINFLHPVAQQRTAILTQNKHSFKIISLDGRAKQYAQVLDKMKHGVLYHSKMGIQTEQFIKDMQIAGMSHFLIEESDKYYPGQFGVTVRHTPWDFVIVDANAKDPSMSDAEGFFIEKEITIEQIKKRFGPIIDEINRKRAEADEAPIDISTFTGVSNWDTTDMTDKQTVVGTTQSFSEKAVLRVYYDYVYTTMYLVRDEEGNLDQVFAENMEEEARTLLATAEGEIPDTYVRKTYCLGDFVIYVEIIPITKLPLITEFYDWGGKPYKSFGMIHYVKSLQESYNKLMQLAILNGILTNNSGWKAPKGAIAPEDKKKWEEFGNNPFVIKEYTPQEIGNSVLIPERDQIQSLSNFYPMLMQIIQQGIEYTTGINPIVQGNAENAKIEVFSTLQTYQNAAMQRIILSAQHIAQALESVGQVVIEYLIWKLRKGDYVFLDDSGNTNEVQIGEDINEFKLNKFLVVSIPSTSMPTQRLAMATELMKIAQSSPDPIERNVLTRKAMLLSEMPEAEDITEEINVAKNLEQKVQQLEEALDRERELNKQMENKVVNVSVENRILKSSQQGLIGLAKELGKSEAEVSIATKLESGELSTTKE